MQRGAVDAAGTAAAGTTAAGTTPVTRHADDITFVSALLLLLALAAAAFGQGAYFSTVRLFIAAVLAVAVVLAVAAKPPRMVDLRDGFAVAGVLLAGWALFRAFTAGTPASGVTWALFGAGTVAAVFVGRRLTESAHSMLFGGLLTVGAAVALTGWVGVALHRQPWGLLSQDLWRAASSLTYTNATAGLLVPLALVALARLTASPRSAPLALAAMCMLTTTALTLSRAGVAALGLGLLMLCWLLPARRVVRAAVAPVLGAGVAALGLVPSLQAAAPARPALAAAAMVAGVGVVIVAQRLAGWRLVLPVAGVVLAATVLTVVLAPQVRHAIHALTHARFTLASPARSGEATAALRVIASHALAGVGPGHPLQWLSPNGAVNVDMYVHDEYLQVLTDLGIVGAVLAAALLIAAGRLLWQIRASSPDRALWAGAVAATVGFALHSGFDFIWQVPVIPLTVAAIVGLALGQPSRERPDPPNNPSTR